jgi:hypothetical protein
MTITNLNFAAVTEGTKITLEAVLPTLEVPQLTDEHHRAYYQECLASIERALPGLLPPYWGRQT